MKSKNNKVRLCLSLCLLLTSCSTIIKPNLKRLYDSSLTTTAQPPVILIHGILGARLRDKNTHQEQWPGSLGKIIFSGYEEAALDIDEQTLKPLPSNLEAFGITDRAAGQDFYGNIIEMLHQDGKYELGEVGIKAQVSDRRYYIFVYDWRQDNVESVKKLDALIESIRKDYDDPKLKVDIVAHSMGGLLARYFIRYGTADVLDNNDFPVNNYGSTRIRRLVLVGTPNFGSLTALQSLTIGYKIGLSKIPVKVLVTMPSIYQLLPHAINSWIYRNDGTKLDDDIFDVATWEKYKWSIFDPEIAEEIINNAQNSTQGERQLSIMKSYFKKNIERARRFTWSLTVPTPKHSVEYYIFGGSCLFTPARIVLEKKGSKFLARYQPSEVDKKLPTIDYEHLMLEPGDGMVTKSSLLARATLDPRVARHKYIHFPTSSTFFLCERHESLTGNTNFQDNLLHTLLYVD